MRPTAILALLLALAFLSTTVSAQALYRWKDEKGVVHYSDKKPEGVEFESREVPAEPAAAEGEDAQADGAEGEAQAAPPQANAQCERVRTNLQVLLNAQVVSLDLDGDGQPEQLDAAARDQQIARHRELEAQYCGGNETTGSDAGTGEADGG
jgi:hypothetical protein